MRTIRLTAALIFAIATFGFPHECTAQAEPTPLERGFEFLKSGKNTEAIAEFKKAIAAKTDSVQAHAGLALAYRGSGKLEDSILEWKTAIGIDPRSANLRLDYGNTLSTTGRLEEAVNQYDIALDIAPLQSRAYISKAASLVLLKRYSEAVRNYQLAEGISPDDPSIHYGLAQTYAETEDWTDAVVEYSATVKLQPASRAGWTGLLSAWNSLKAYSKAAPAAEALLKNADDLDIRSALAIAYDGLDRRDEAIREYRKILEVSSGNPLIWGNLGWTQYGAGLYADAIVSSKKALQIDASLAYVRFNLALIYAVQGDSLNSMTEYGTAVKKCLPADLKAGLDDLKEALKKKPNNNAMRDALRFLEKQ